MLYRKYAITLITFALLFSVYVVVDLSVNVRLPSERWIYVVLYALIGIQLLGLLLLLILVDVLLSIMFEKKSQKTYLTSYIFISLSLFFIFFLRLNDEGYAFWLSWLVIIGGVVFAYLFRKSKPMSVLILTLVFAFPVLILLDRLSTISHSVGIQFPNLTTIWHLKKQRVFDNDQVAEAFIIPYSDDNLRSASQSFHFLPAALYSEHLAKSGLANFVAKLGFIAKPNNYLLYPVYNEEKRQSQTLNLTWHDVSIIGLYNQNQLIVLFLPER